MTPWRLTGRRAIPIWNHRQRYIISLLALTINSLKFKKKNSSQFNRQKKLTDETSSGKTKIIRKEKHHATSTANVTIMWCLYQSPYRYKMTAASKNAAKMSKINIPADMINCSILSASNQPAFCSQLLVAFFPFFPK